MNRRPNDLASFEQSVWKTLERGAASARAPWHLGTVCTVAADGTPSARTVVLRAAAAATRQLVFHTDARSSKVADLERDPRLTWLFYDAELKWQARIRATAVVHRDDEVTAERWRASRLSSRRCYLAQPAPGSELDAPGSGLAEPHLSRSPTEEESAPGYVNFSVVVTTALHIDALSLAAQGHRRAAFDYSAGEVAAAWLVP